MVKDGVDFNWFLITTIVLRIQKQVQVVDWLKKNTTHALE